MLQHGDTWTSLNGKNVLIYLEISYECLKLSGSGYNEDQRVLIEKLSDLQDLSGIISLRIGPLNIMITENPYLILTR